MTTFRDQLSADLSIFYDSVNGFAEDVVYITQGTGSVNVVALIDRNGVQSGNAGTARYARVRVRKSEVAEAAPNDTISFDSLTWTVCKIEKETTLEWTLIAHAEESHAFSAGYRT